MYKKKQKQNKNKQTKHETILLISTRIVPAVLAALLHSSTRLVLFHFFTIHLFPLLSHSRSSIYVSPSTAQARLTLGSLSEQCEVHIAFPRIIFFSSLFTPTHHIPPLPHSLSMFFFLSVYINYS